MFVNKECSISVIEHVSVSPDSKDSEPTALGDHRFLVYEIIRPNGIYTYVYIYIFITQRKKTQQTVEFFPIALREQKCVCHLMRREITRRNEFTMAR